MIEFTDAGEIVESSISRTPPVAVATINTDNITRVEIFLNETRGHRYSEFHDGDELRRAFVGDLDAKGFDDIALLNWLYEQFNINHPDEYRDRSLSAGDVVTLNESRSYAVERCGFRLLAEAITGATDGGDLPVVLMEIE